MFQIQNRRFPFPLARRCCTLWALLLLAAACGSSGQRADTEYQTQVTDPAWPEGLGPIVAVDAAHHNFHTIEGRYRAFADLLRADGFRVRSFDTRFTPDSLTQELDILVISNALAESNSTSENWRLPVAPAFSENEVQAVMEWIQRGGSLLLIADHMPMPAAAASLAFALGIEFTNTYAIRQGDEERRRPFVFRRQDGVAAPSETGSTTRPEAGEGTSGSGKPLIQSEGILQPHPILEGRGENERIDQVATFTGQAFRGHAIQPLLTFGPGIEAVYPEVFGDWNESTRRHPVEGWHQGATLEMGEGRVAVFGEAAMFSAQISSSGGHMGMNAEVAAQNPRFLLNVMNWLSGVLE